MPQYRIYHLDGSGRVNSADWLEADGDEAAIGVARDCNTLHCELWRGRRLVTRITARAEQSSHAAARGKSTRPGIATRA